MGRRVSDKCLISQVSTSPQVWHRIAVVTACHQDQANIYRPHSLLYTEYFREKNSAARGAWLELKGQFWSVAVS